MSIDREFRVKHGLIVDGDVNFTGTLYQNGEEFRPGGALLPDTLHGLTVDDGMLVYTKTNLDSDASEQLDIDFDLVDPDISTLSSNNSNYSETTGANTLYSRLGQYYYGSTDVSYFIDDDGYMVMRTNRTWTYTEPK